MRSAGRRRGVWPTRAAPQVLRVWKNWSRVSWVLKPGMVSSLSNVPPVWPRLLPEIMGTQIPGTPAGVGEGRPGAAGVGAGGREVLAPRPAGGGWAVGEGGRGVGAEVSPEEVMDRGAAGRGGMWVAGVWGGRAAAMGDWSAEVGRR